MPNHLLGGLAEVRLVRRDGAATAKPDAGDAADRGIGGDVQERAIDPVHMLRDILEHEHVSREIRLPGCADLRGQDDRYHHPTNRGEHHPPHPVAVHHRGRERPAQPEQEDVDGQRQREGRPAPAEGRA